MPNFFRRKFLATSAISASAIVLAQTKVYAADAVQKLKKSLVEIPVYYQAREGGVSKTNFFKEIFRYTKTVLKIKLRIEKYF